MNKIDGVLFTIIAVLFIGGGTWLIHHNNTVIEQEKQLIAEHEAQKPVIKEIKRPDQCDEIAARMAWSDIHINKQYKNCWWDTFDYKGSFEKGRPHGKGLLTVKGITFDAIFENGKYLGDLQSSINSHSNS